MEKALNLLGLARRSGHLICGTDSVIKEMQKGKLHLIVLALDASNNTQDKIVKKAHFYAIQVIQNFDALTLQKATGTKSLVYGIDDIGFKQAICKEVIPER